MGLVRKFVAGLILTIVLLSLATSFAAYLGGTHQSCSPSSIQLPASGGTSTNGQVPLSGAPVPSGLVLTPLVNLSLTTPQGGNGSAIADLTDPGYWRQVDGSELQTYEQLVPQTALGFFNSSQEWRDWALQNFPSPPGWLSYGIVPYSEGLVQALEPASGGTGNSTAVAQGIQGFAASAAGLDLAALDYVSFNGLTALRVLFQTRDAELAACQTLPGQLGQLYDSAFDPTVPQADRAQYLGRALAITSIMLVVGGKDGLADQFHGALDGVGLGDSWPAVKPYLGDIASKVSAGASSATLGILQTLAGRFPQDSAFVTGFTADRVDSMVDVLEKKGVSNDVIQGDIGQIAQAAGSASDEQAIGEAADQDSLKQGGGMQVFVKTANKIVLYYDTTGRTANIRGTFLQTVIPGFNPRGPDFVKIHYQEAGVTVYHYYDAKVAAGAKVTPSATEWNPRVPKDVAKPGDIVTVSFGLLTTEDFLNSVPPIDYLNTGQVPWAADFSEVQFVRLVGNEVQMSVDQEPIEGVSSFVLDGTPTSLANSNGDTFLEFSIPNVVNDPRTLKITFDGYGQPLLSIQSSSNFNPVTMISSDGIRLRIVSNSGGSAVTTSTLYLQEPSAGWNLGTMSEQNLGFPVNGASETFKIDQVSGARDIENGLAHSSSTNDLGRVGAEIAYTVAQEEFHLNGLRLYEITQGGKDLDTRDGTVVIQARMLASPNDLTGSQLPITLSTQMNDLTKKLGEDFDKNPDATTGYAILSYLDPSTNTIYTLVAVVLRQ